MPAREQRLRRRVPNDALVDVHTVRYSVPHEYVRTHVEVAVGERDVRIFRGSELIATHARPSEPHARITQAAHYKGLWREPATTATDESMKIGGLAAYGRSLKEYEAALLPEVTA
jgi:hypothetical protein